MDNPSISQAAPTQTWLDSLPLSKCQSLLEVAKAETIKRHPPPLWVPDPGPQTEALNSPANLTFYGGSAGGGKTSLLIGLAITQHRNSVIFRREFPQLKDVREQAAGFLTGHGRYNGQDQRWRLDDGRVLEFGACQHETDKENWQGRAHDLVAFDELTHFTESQFRFLIAWNRSTDPTQRVRVVCAGNPPTSAEGDWVIEFWRPWLDPAHPYPAQSGEIRWFASVDGKDVERQNGDPFDHIDERSGKTETIRPLSRTFIRAFLRDNVRLARTNYGSNLQSLPEPLRSKLLYGDFSAGREDDPQQVIPTEWIAAAQARWTPDAPGWMDALGVDVARGGADETVLTPRHGNWMGPQLIYPGTTTPDGAAVAQLIWNAIPSGHVPQVNIDVIGVGSSPYDHAIQVGLNAEPMNASNASHARDASGQLGFRNMRAEWYWKFREALDPASGNDIALPPDRLLRADLTAPRWKMSLQGIQIESKDDIKARINRSTDRGDSAVLAFAVPYRRPTLQIL